MVFGHQASERASFFFFARARRTAREERGRARPAGVRFFFPLPLQVCVLYGAGRVLSVTQASDVLRLLGTSPPFFGRGFHYPDKELRHPSPLKCGHAVEAEEERGAVSPMGTDAV
jgi:hypothetical protein